MSLLEALYGKSCNTPISWSDPVNKLFIGMYVEKDGTKDVGYQE